MNPRGNVNRFFYELRCGGSVKWCCTFSWNRLIIGSTRKRADVDKIETARRRENGKKEKGRNEQTPVTVRARGWLHILISKRAERNARHTSVCLPVERLYLPIPLIANESFVPVSCRLTISSSSSSSSSSRTFLRDQGPMETFQLRAFAEEKTSSAAEKFSV